MLQITQTCQIIAKKDNESPPDDIKREKDKPAIPSVLSNHHKDRWDHEEVTMN